MRTIDDFSRSERRSSTDKLRRVDSSNAAKITYKQTYQRVCFLIRLFDKLDESIPVAPADSVVFARYVVEMAERIPTHQTGEGPASHLYRNEQEKRDFVAWAKVVFVSACRAAGQFNEAKRKANELLRIVEQLSPIARAEVFRRAAVLAADLHEFERSVKLLDEAIAIYRDIEDAERLALSHVCRGSALNLLNGPGSGSIEYARAIYYASAAINSSRSKRALLAAASNIAMDAARVPSTSAKEAYTLVQGAVKALAGRPVDVPKLNAYWARALLAYRLGLGKYAVRWLRKVRDGLLKLGAITEAMVCSLDLLTIAGDQSDDIGRLADECLIAIRGALEGSQPDAETLAAIEEWAAEPTDLGALRELWGEGRAVISRQA